MAMTAVGSDNLHANPNVTPLIDVLLVLLTIFMVIVPVAPKGINAVLPQAPKTLHPVPATTVVVQIFSSPVGPVYKINQQSLADKAALTAELSRIYSSRAEKVLFLQGDPALDFASVAAVLDISRGLGIDHVGILTPGLQASA